MILALDDYHTITSQEAHHIIHYFINHAPDHFHLMIVSRVEPPLPLTRWRMYRELIEIRENDLRFTLDEAMTFLLDTMRCAITRADVAALEQRTEGWIVGLHLAALEPGFYSGIVRLMPGESSDPIIGDPARIRVNTWVAYGDNDVPSQMFCEVSQFTQKGISTRPICRAR